MLTHALAFAAGVVAACAFLIWLGSRPKRGANSIEPVRENVVPVVNGRPPRRRSVLRRRLWR